MQTLDDLNTILATKQPGSKVSVGIARPDGSMSTVTVTLGQLPSS